MTVFYNIDSWLVDYAPNDLFDKKLGGIDLVLMDMVKETFTRFYETIRKNKVLDDKSIQKLLKMKALKIRDIYKVTSVQQPTGLYNDNMLISVYGKKIRHAAAQESSKKGNINLINSKEYQFHPSFAAIESLLSISTSSPGVSGDINPYAVIDEQGHFLKDKMPWYSEILPMEKYVIQM